MKMKDNTIMKSETFSNPDCLGNGLHDFKPEKTHVLVSPDSNSVSTPFTKLTRTNYHATNQLLTIVQSKTKKLPKPEVQ